MLWSSFFPNEVEKIPNVGHLVTYCDRLHPFIVEHRCIVEGTVYLQIRSGDIYVHRERLEVLNWYPEVGDLVVAAAKPYLDWRKIHRDYALPEWLYQKMELLEIEGKFATVRPTGKGQQKQKVPFNSLRVIEKKLMNAQAAQLTPAAKTASPDYSSQSQPMQPQQGELISA